MKKFIFILCISGLVIWALIYRYQLGTSIHTPAFSPDGSLIIFTLENNAGTPHIYTAPSSGGMATPLASKDIQGFGAVISPNRNDIAYATIINDARPIILIFNSRNGIRRKLFDSDFFSYAPKFSPDGSSLYFVGSKRFGQHVGFWLDSGIYSVSLDGAHIKLIGEKHCKVIGGYSISPLGNELVADMSCGDKEKLWKIVLNQDSTWKPLRPIINGVPDTCTECSFPTYMPNGKSIVFIRPRREGGPYIGDDIYAMDIDSGVTKLVLRNDGYIYEPSISQKENSLIFISARGADRGSRECRLRILNMNDGAQRNIEITTTQWIFGTRKVSDFQC